jgi:hypothetical protein
VLLVGRGLKFLYVGDPKVRRSFLKIDLSERFHNLITFKILSLKSNTLIPPLFPLFETVLELLQ